jgi:hypothetical protein
MLELLVRQGKLRKVNLGSETCAHCDSRHNCVPWQTGNLMGSVYEPAENNPNEGVADVKDG